MTRNEQTKTKGRLSTLLFRRWPWTTIVMLSILLLACDEDDKVDLNDGTAQTFAEVIASADPPEKIQKKEEILDQEEHEELGEDGSLWICTTTTYSVEDGNSDFPLFNPNASVVYPGSLLQGKTLTNASPSVIPLKRAGGTISIDIIDGSSQPAFSVDEVSKSSIATAANNIIGASTGTVPANFNASFEEISSEEHLAFSLGLDAQSQYVQVASKFAFSQDKEYNHFLVKLNQSFYTLSFDLPTSYDDLFAPEVTPKDLQQYAGPGNPVTFISDVTYGRIYYMLIEYKSSDMSIQAELKAAFSGAIASADISATTDVFQRASDLQIKVVAFGGESKSTFSTIGEKNINKLAEMFGESTDIRSGVPISYVVRDAKNKETVGVKLATEYDVKECKAIATALGEPIMWLDATALDLSSTEYEPCADCLEYDGVLRYFEPNDSYARENLGKYDGTVVRQWKDISGNGNHASSIAGDTRSRPMFVPNAFDNGKAAVEFYRGAANTILPGKIHNRLSYSGGIFVNTDYTIFLVLSYPDRVKLETRASNGNWRTEINSANNWGYFMDGTSSHTGEKLRAGFQRNNLFRFSHQGSQVFIEKENIATPSKFQVYALRFSQTEGMSIYANGVLIGKDASKKLPLNSNIGAVITIGHITEELPGHSRLRIGEIKAYQQAATEAQIRQETQYLNQKYGL